MPDNGTVLFIGDNVQDWSNVGGPINFSLRCFATHQNVWCLIGLFAQLKINSQIFERCDLRYDFIAANNYNADIIRARRSHDVLQLRKEV